MICLAYCSTNQNEASEVWCGIKHITTQDKMKIFILDFCRECDTSRAVCSGGFWMIAMFS